MKKFINDIDLNNNRITNLSNPVNQLDGISKDYLDDNNVDNLDIYNYNYSSTITTPPLSGEVRLNSLVFSSTTELYIHITDLFNFDSSDTLINLFQNQRIKIQQQTDKSKFVIYEITNTTDNTGYYTLEISYIKESNSGPSQNSDCVVIFENLFTFTGTSNTENLNSGIIKDDGVVSTGTRILLDDGSFKEFRDVKTESFISATVSSLNYQASNEDHIFCDTSSNNITIELPSINGKEYNITKISDFNQVIITATSSGLVNGDTELRMIYKNNTASLKGVGENYWLI